MSDRSDVGFLSVKVRKAEGINPEYVWRRNPLAVLEVGNTRMQTKKQNGTVSPEWNKTFYL